MINSTMKTFLHITIKTSMILLLSITGMRSYSQVDQRIAMANKYFDAGEYFTAADLYEQYLNPVKKEIPKANFLLNTKRYGYSGSGGVDKYDIVFKQAESYRLANYWQEAASKYKDCFEKDFNKYDEAFYWYAVCQRNLGKYATAEEYLNRYIKISFSDDVKKEQAEKELRTLQFIKQQLSRPDSVLFTVSKTQTSFSHEKGIFALTGLKENYFIYTTTVSDAVNGNNESPNHNRMFYGTLNNGVLQDPEMIEVDETDMGMNQGAATMNADRSILYFTQWKKVSGKNISSIYYSRRNENGWSKPVLLSSINRDGFCSKQPYCSPDGKTLYFSSNMPGGSGDFDIWYASINADGTTSEPVNAGKQVNTDKEEQAPFYHNASNTLVFSSNGREGMGGFDLYQVKKTTNGFGIAENMGNPVNSSRDDIYFYAPNEKEILNNAIVGSDRGSECCLETYSIHKTPKSKTINGYVYDCKTNQPVNKATVLMRDASGRILSFTTAENGKYSFELPGEAEQQTFNITKENYTERTEKAVIEKINNKDYLVDVFTNMALCLEPIIKEEKKLVIRAENVVTVYFDFDKSNIRTRGQEILDSIYITLAENATYTIQISGYTDGLGTNEYNQKLSDRRAKACADYLVKKGLDPDRISFVSFGKCCPVEMEIINGRDNPDGRQMNRRALINISKEE